MYNSFCITCQKPISSKHPQKYCDRKCYHSSPIKKRTMRCKICGKEKEIPKSSKQKYCSRECQHKAFRMKIYIRTCPICGEKYRTRKKRNGEFLKNACSPKCGYKFGKQKQRERGDYPGKVISFGRSVPLSWGVAEKKLGRKLRKGEIVHHLDCNHKNNSPENIWICKNKSEHSSIHARVRKLHKELFALGILKFDKTIKSYILDYELVESLGLSLRKSG